MPYEIRKEGEAYLVVNKDTGDVKARHEPPDAKEKAEKQLNLLHAIEHIIHLDRLMKKHHRERMSLHRRQHKEVLDALRDSQGGGGVPSGQ